jgi:hypothetical protein
MKKKIKKTHWKLCWVANIYFERNINIFKLTCCMAL